MAAKKISIGLLYGLISAAFMILFILGTYFAGPKVFVGQLAFLSYAIVIAFGVAAALAQKRANGGWLGFQQGVKTCFTTFVLGLGVRSFFPWLLVNVFDTHFKQLLIPEIAANIETSYRNFGVAEDTIRQLLEENKKDPFPFGPMVLYLAFGYIIHFLIALLIAAIVKKKQEPAGRPGI